MKNLSVLIIGLLISLSSLAQIPLNQYYMDMNPYSYQLNPGRLPDFKAYIGIPALSSITPSVSNSGFAFKDLMDFDEYQFDRMVDQLRPINNLSINYQSSILSFGFSLDSTKYISFNSSVRTMFDFSYSKDFMSFFVQGNFVDGEAKSLIDFTGTGINATAFVETGVGYTQNINKLTVGGRVKLLNGIANLGFDLNDVQLRTNPEDFSLTVNSNLEARSSGIALIGDENEPSINPMANLGLGFDIGGSYKFNDKIEVSLNVLDIGFISWKDGYRYFNDSASFTYEGVPFNDISEAEGNAFENISDSLVEIFEIKEEVGHNYRSALPTRFILGGKYTINKMLSADGLYSGRFVNNKLYSAVVLGGTFKLKKLLQARLSYSIINNTYTNVGAGLSINAGAFQFYIVSDNALGFTRVDYSRTLNFSTGMSVVLGRGKRSNPDVE